MDSVKIKDGSRSKLWYLFHSISFLMLLTINFIDTSAYNFIIIIIRSSLSLLIIILMFNYVEYRYKYIKFIGVAYIVSNIIDMLSLIIINQQNIINNINIISCSLESIAFFIAIKFLLKESNNKKIEIIKYMKLFALFIGTILFINLSYKILNIDSFKITILLIYILNIFILMISIKIIYLYNKRVDKLKMINYILYIKIIYFTIMIFTYNNYFNSKLTYMLLDFTSILQMYLVYKIVIQNILINPYIKILKANEDIKKGSKDQEEINLLLERVNQIKDKIKEKIIYKEEFFKSILSSTPNGWIIFDENLKIIYSNESFKRIINHTIGDIFYSMNLNIMDCDKFLSNIYKVNKDKIKREDLIKTIDNKIYKCVYFSDEINKQLVCLIFDVTSESDILTNLVNLKKEYEDLIRNIKTPVFIFDDKSNIISFSKSYEIVFDRYKSYMLDNQKLDMEIFLETIHPKDKDMVSKVYAINQMAISNEDLYNKGLFRFRILNENKEIVWLESKTNIYYEDDIKYKILSYRDITKYMNSKRYLEKTQEIYKGLLNSIPEGIYLEDTDSGEYIFINQKFKDIFNVKQRLENKNYKIYRNDVMNIHPDYKHILYNGIEKIKNDKISDYEYVKYIDNDDNMIESKVASLPFKLDNQVFKLSIIKTMEDIKKLEVLKNKIIERDKHDKMKMEFFINMSHELKTPLNLIFTSTQLIESLYMKNKLSGDSIKKHIKLTKQNSYRLLKIINNLIDFTKMESGFYNINMENKDIVISIEDIVMSVVEYANNKGIEVIFDTNVEELIMGIDISALEIIILNILSNAIKFTKYGGYVYIDLIYKEDIKQIDVVIKDTGIGIPKDKMNLIFKRFNDVNRGFIGNIDGSGIGLSMVKSMSNLIGSKINVESEYGKGSVFTITLDVKEVESENHIYDITHTKNETLNIEKLIVEMEDIYR